MKKLKIKRKGFGFELVLEGEIKIDESKIKPYEDYVREQQEGMIREQLRDYLDTIMVSASEKDYSIFSDFSKKMGAQAARDELVEYLMKNMEREE